MTGFYLGIGREAHGRRRLEAGTSEQEQSTNSRMANSSRAVTTNLKPGRRELIDFLAKGIGKELEPRRTTARKWTPNGEEDGRTGCTKVWRV
jgi:hypothetical protein